MKKKRRSKKVVPATGVPNRSPAAQYVLRRLVVFNVSNVVLCLALTVFIVLHLDIAQQKLASIPSWITKLFLGAWALSILYRLYLRNVRNENLRRIGSDPTYTRKYASTQIVTTLVGLFFVSASALYLSGILQPVVDSIAAYYLGVDPKVVEAALVVLSGLLWNIVASAIWDLIKWLWRSKKSP